jgi:1,4-alpha-glucan branching enzyme
MPYLIVAALIGAAAAAGAEAAVLGAEIQKTNGVASGVIFRVWAPNAVQVNVEGDFNNWGQSQMSMTNGGGGVWSRFVSQARPGDGYRYSIVGADGQVLPRKDPRAREVRAGPGGKLVGVVYDPGGFVWDDQAFQPPSPSEIVMYEMHIGTFYDPNPGDGKPGTFYDAVKKLPYLQSLGVNMIALMPVSEFRGDHSWGYNPIAPFAIESAYGGPDGLKHFVNEAHKMGMAVQADIVHNHYGEAGEGGLSDLENFDGGDPYFYNSSDETGRPGIRMTPWGPRPRFSDQNVRNFIKDNVRMYLDEYHIWAIRWDSPRNITGYDSQSVGVPGDPDTAIPEAITMMQEINEEIRTRNQSYYSISEDANSPGDYEGHWEISFHNTIFPRLLPLDVNGGLPAPFSQSLFYPSLNVRSGQNIGYRLTVKEPPGFRVIFSENHDKCGDLNQLTDGARLVQDFDPQNPASETAQKKAMLATGLVLSAAGTPMLFQGQEQMADGWFGAYNPVDWKRGAGFLGSYRFHRDMIRLRRNLDGVSEAFLQTGLPDNIDNGSGACRIIEVDEEEGWMVFGRGADSDELIIIANFSGENRITRLPSSLSGIKFVLLNSIDPYYGSGFLQTGPATGSSVNLNTSGGRQVQVGGYGLIILGPSPREVRPPDEDGDGLDDAWESLFAVSSPSGDEDADGFLNLDEFSNGTDPTVADRAIMSGTFNEESVTGQNARWDRQRGVWRFVARFFQPGAHTVSVKLAPGWVEQLPYSFVITSPGTYEISYSPSNNSYGLRREDADSNSNGIADLWEQFYFYPAVAAEGGADPDGDGISNSMEFSRGSDPTEGDYQYMGVVGDFNGWNWGQRNMRYAGYGVWMFVAHGSSGLQGGYKFGVGPTSEGPDWGAPTVQNPSGYKSPTDFSWGNGLGGWVVVFFSEKNFSSRVLLGDLGGDQDGDEMPDNWEFYFNLDPFNPSDAAGDSDGDGVSNRIEYMRGSQPSFAGDSYTSLALLGDTLPYSGESGWGDRTDPRLAMRRNYQTGLMESIRFAPAGRSLTVRVNNLGEDPGWITPENQPISLPARGNYIVGFNDYQKTYHLRTMPSDDDDGDGLPDYWETWFGVASPSEDPDGDGLLNSGEFQRGSDPLSKDKSSAMSVVGDIYGWHFSKGSMRWNSAMNRWWRYGQHSATGEKRIRFVAATNLVTDPYSSLNWTQNAHWGETEAGSGLATRGGVDIGYTVGQSSRRVFFEFDEVWGYSIRALGPGDGDGDGIPDEWEQYYGIISSSSGDVDGDGWSNLSEYNRDTDPSVNEGVRFAMTVSGTGNLVPNWNPDLNNMTWSEARARWEFIATAGVTGTVEFKFFRGPSWSGDDWGGMNGGAVYKGGNISTSVQSGRRYRISFDDIGLAYEVAEYTVGDEWKEANGLSVNDGWLLDKDGDGYSNIMEYALGGNPTSGDAATRALVRHSTEGQGSGAKLVMRWLERVDGGARGLIYTPLLISNSITGGSWTATGSVEAARQDGVGAGFVLKESTTPIQPGIQKYMRLRIQGPQ